jgi:hypothetical protein
MVSKQLNLFFLHRLQEKKNMLRISTLVWKKPRLVSMIMRKSEEKETSLDEENADAVAVHTEPGLTPEVQQ